MANGPSRMRQEINEIPHAAARLIDASKKPVKVIASKLNAQSPSMMATIARGSSDHAASFFKYCAELKAGLPVASLGPSVASVFGAQLKMQHSVTFAISQSGKSPDIISMAQSARLGGSLTIALTNAIDSPLAQACELALDICAGPEFSVAATKTFVNSIIATMLLIAGMTDDDEFAESIEKLPDRLAAAIETDWSPLCQVLAGHSSLYILGRGPSYAIACEAALKFKETSGLHAEAFSSAEVMHGPVSIVSEGFPVLVVAARDRAEDGLAAIADQLVKRGAKVFATSGNVKKAAALPFVATGYPLTDALVQIASFYGFIEMLARQRGFDPDVPRHLRKVTETI